MKEGIAEMLFPFSMLLKLDLWNPY